MIRKGISQKRKYKCPINILKMFDIVCSHWNENQNMEILLSKKRRYYCHSPNWLHLKDFIISSTEKNARKWKLSHVAGRVLISIAILATSKYSEYPNPMTWYFHFLETLLGKHLEKFTSDMCKHNEPTIVGKSKNL